MATYQVTGKDSGGSPLVSVNITSIDQDGQLVQEIDVVNAVRTFLSTVSGVNSVVAQKYQQVVTVV